MYILILHSVTRRIKQTKILGQKYQMYSSVYATTNQLTQYHFLK